MAVLKLLAILLYCSTTVNGLLREKSERNFSNTTIESVNAVNEYRLPHDTIPLHYNVRLIPHIVVNNFSLEGEVRTILRVQSETSKIVLHAKSLRIHETDTSIETADRNVLKPKAHRYNNETEMVHLLFENILTPGIYSLSLKFDGAAGKDLYGFYSSFYKDEENNTVWLGATHFQPIAARRAFPCWDEPALKATVNISIKHFSNYTALSNMPIYAKEFDKNDGKVWSHFEMTPTMSTNILAFVVANYPHITNEDGTVRVWTRKSALPHTEYILDIAQRATVEFEKYLNNTVRVPKVDHVSVPHYSTRATENWGLIVYHENALIHNEETERTTRKISNIMTVIHETAHQWFGNLVSPAWWTYQWLSEGMATYLKYYMFDKLFNNCKVMDTFVILVQQQAAFFADEEPNTPPMNKDVNTPRDIKGRNSLIVYRKSASVIRMLSHIVSDDVFRSGLIKYINTNEYDSVTSDDLWNAMQDALDESEIPYNDLQVKEVMDTWVEQAGYPIITVNRDYDSGTAIIYQESSTASKDPIPKKWWIPLTYATKSNLDFSSTLPTHWLRPDVTNTTIADIDKDDWIIANLQETGYYRVNYDEKNWRLIAKYLNSDDYSKVHVINRAQIIDDAYYLMTLKRFNPEMFIDITNYLARETDYVPWLAAFNILSSVTKYLRHPQGGEILKPYILHLMDNLIESVSFEENPDDDYFTKLKRVDVLTWACNLGHAECKAKATAKLVAHLQDPEINKISPDMKEWTYCMGLMQANQSIWNKVFQSQADELTYDALSYLGCSENPTITENYLNMSINQSTNIWKFYSNDIFTFLNQDIPSHANTLLNFVTKNWNDILSMTSDPYSILDNLIWRIYSDEDLQRLKSFISHVAIYKDSLVNYRERALEKIQNEVSIIRSWLTEYNSKPTKSPADI